MDSKLNQFIKNARADYERALAEFARIKSTGYKKAISRIETQVSLASGQLRHYESLTTAAETKVSALLQDARKDRKQASRYKHSNPALAEAALQSANSREQSYLLWCDHHGKAPVKELSNVQLLGPAEAPKIKGRGGPRPNAGRPCLGHVQVLLKCKPETAEELRALAKAEGLTLGGWLDSHIEFLRCA
jgi:hypothetical protein